MDTISLFSGCGGLDMGAEAAGAKIQLSVESDRDSAATLRRAFPGTQVREQDIREVRDFPKADLVIGGYPCQSFSMGGNRNPTNDPRTFLYREFVRCVNEVHPKYFVAENVSGLKSINNGSFLEEQFAALRATGHNGYRLTAQVLNARDYGVPQSRKRIFIVGVRNDLEEVFRFPPPTHGKRTRKQPHLRPYASHGEAIRGLPLWPTGEFYERPHDPEGHFSWYYMSRNRKAKWAGPAFTVVANWRHTTLHPASPVMTLTWSNLADNWKQRWDFSDEFEHLDFDPTLPVLNEPRRLSWRECARIQTFPADFEPVGTTKSKFQQIGNAVPPLLAEAVLQHLLSGDGLVDVNAAETTTAPVPRQLAMW